MYIFSVFLLELYFASLVISIFYVPGITNRDKIHMRDVNNKIYPWIGVLKVRTYGPVSYFIQEGITTIILIKKRVAICSAGDIHSIKKETLRENATVILYNGIQYKRFESDVQEWESYVTDYSIHPEFQASTTNSIAVLILEKKSKVPDYFWQPIDWPTHQHVLKNGKLLVNQEFFAVGYTDRKKILEQITYKMMPVDKKECIKFYVNEGLDFKTLWPNHYNCFKEKKKLDSCLYDAGMALVDKTTGNWTLIGMSTYGPGCSLPARFIEFHPYIPWIQSLPIIPDEKKLTYTRRTIDKSWKFEKAEDLDWLSYQKFISKTFEIKEYGGETIFWNKNLDNKYKTSKKESADYSAKEIDEKCRNNSKSVYAEEGTFGTRNNDNLQTVFYSLTLYEKQLFKWTCIRVKINCTRHSRIQTSFDKGFKQDYPTIENKYTNLTLQDGYGKFRRRKTITIWFKFTFRSKAFIHVILYMNQLKIKKPQPTKDVFTEIKNKFGIGEKPESDWIETYDESEPGLYLSPENNKNLTTTSTTTAKRPRPVHLEKGQQR